MFDKGETYKKGDLVEDTDLPEKTRRLGIVLKVERKVNGGHGSQYLYIRWQDSGVTEEEHKKTVQFILYGENYNTMTFHKELMKRFVCAAQDWKKENPDFY